MFTILTIDDEENIRNGLADNFELEGYEVKKAASGKEEQCDRGKSLKEPKPPPRPLERSCIGLIASVMI